MNYIDFRFPACYHIVKAYHFDVLTSDLFMRRPMMQRLIGCDVLGRESKDCTHNHCGACCGGDCGGCGGCGGHDRALFLTQSELDLLLRFAQIPFLPVARHADADVPVYLEDGDDHAEAYGQTIAALHQKALIALDYQLPLSNFDYAAYRAYAQQGSMALTAMGQRIVEQLEIQGVEQ